MSKIADTVAGAEGFYTGASLNEKELELTRSLVRDHWLQRIREAAPGEAGHFEKISMEDYHLLANKVSHDELWRKTSRILPTSSVEKLRQTSLLKTLEADFGPFVISDEENMGYENIYWRLVRPGKNADVGSLHADQWFWEIQKTPMLPGHFRVKVWVAIFCEPGKTGLRVVPGSHKKNYKYHSFDRDGRVKPQLDEKEEDLNVMTLPTKPGTAVVFHDMLLHGGAAAVQSDKTRVSMEFTMLVPLKNGK